MRETNEPSVAAVEDTRGSIGTAPPTRTRRALVFGAACTLALGLTGAGTVLIRAGAASTPRPPAAATPAVETLTLERLEGHEARRAYAARVEPAREALLSFESGGTLVAVNADEGERVAAGDVLARLDTRLLEARRAQLAAAREALDSDAELARLALGRQRVLEGRGFAADEALDEARLNVTRIASRLAEADAALALVDVELDKAVLRAPFDAVIGARLLDPGATVGSGAPVLALLESGAPRLRVGLPPERARALDAERTYTFTANGREVTARLVARRGDVDERTRTVSTLFEPLDGAAAGLLFGELLELVLIERVPGAVFDVPLAALAEDERGLWSVMAVVDAARTVPGSGDGAGRDPDRRQPELSRVAVEIVHLTGTRAYVRAAVDAGTRIVAGGLHRVVDGERVRLAGSDRAAIDPSPSRRALIGKTPLGTNPDGGLERGRHARAPSAPDRSPRDPRAPDVATTDDELTLEEDRGCGA